MQHEFLTNKEFCALLRCSTITAWRLRRDEENFPKPGYLGRRLRWNQEHVKQALAFVNTQQSSNYRK